MESINEKLKRLAKEKEAKNPNMDGVEKLPQYRGNSVIPANALYPKSNKGLTDIDKSIDVGSKGFTNKGVNYDLLTDSKEGTSPLLLNLYPGAAIALALRKLDINYIGPAIRVRRVSDDSEMDIGFVDNELDTASLLDFVGTSGSDNGFVVTRYDQSGNGYDLEQSTSSRQPQIVSSGSVITDSNGKPMIEYDGTDDVMSSSSNITSGTSARSIFTVQKADDTATRVRLGISNSSSVGGVYLIQNQAGIVINTFARRWDSSTPIPTVSTSLVSNIYTSGNIYAGTSVWLDGNSVTRTGGTDGAFNTLAAPIREGSYFNGSSFSVHWDGLVGDTIIYASDQSANRVAIESNINDYYNIY